MRTAPALLLLLAAPAMAQELPPSGNPDRSALTLDYAAASPDQAPTASTAAMPTDGGTYRQSGDRSVRPRSIGDDGAKTYIIWDEDQAMPAVFAIGPSGKEEMVEGYMRGGIFTIDRVYDRLVFRIDGDAAKARRDIARGRK